MATRLNFSHLVYGQHFLVKRKPVAFMLADAVDVGNKRSGFNAMPKCVYAIAYWHLTANEVRVYK